tara:strand:+ start:3620 stop:3997 length:378 start_codon:yes stop_codon:yes gene_type:complete
MAHYAKVNNGIVEQVIVAEEDFFNNFTDNSAGEWIQTSYNTRGGKHYVANSNWETESEDQTKALRKNYACIGYTYDETRDAFYAPQPYPSWTLNEDTCLWEAPVAKPNDGTRYEWNEETQTWDSV